MYGIRDLVAVEATDLTVRLQLILITDQIDLVQSYFLFRAQPSHAAKRGRLRGYL